MVTPVRIAELAFVQSPINDGGHTSARAWIRSTAGEVRAVVKDVPRHELIREVVCNLLAQSIGLKTPEAFVVRSNDALWLNPESHPWLFGTVLVGESNFARSARRNVIGLAAGLNSWASLLTAIGFDTWIGNEDRTPENLIFLGKKDFAVIDHGEAFPQHMRPTTRYRNHLANHLIAANDGIRRQELAQRVLGACASFSAVSMEELQVGSLAEAWGANPEFAACCRLLEDRRSVLPELIEALFDTGQGQLLVDTSDAI